MERVVSRTQRRCHGRACEKQRHIFSKNPTTWKTRLLVGGLANSLIRHSDRVKVGLPCAARECDCPDHDQRERPVSADHLLSLQLGPPVRARLGIEPVSGPSPTYEVSGIGSVPYLDMSGTVAPEDGKISLFILNRDLSKAHEVEVNWEDRVPARVLAASVLTGNDLKASNSFEAPRNVVPQPFAKPAAAGGRTKFEVPPRSYTVIQWGS